MSAISSEEDGASVGNLEQPLLARNRTVKAPRSCRKGLGFDSSPAEWPRSHLDEGPVAEPAFAVDGARISSLPVPDSP